MTAATQSQSRRTNRKSSNGKRIKEEAANVQAALFVFFAGELLSKHHCRLLEHLGQRIEEFRAGRTVDDAMVA